jgi:hypothetical protein
MNWYKMKSKLDAVEFNCGTIYFITCQSPKETHIILNIGKQNYLGVYITPLLQYMDSRDNIRRLSLSSVTRPP